MNEIREKPKMRMPKMLDRSNLLPREAGRMLKKDYANQQDERRSQTQYAVNRVEKLAQGASSYSARVGAKTLRKYTISSTYKAAKPPNPLSVAPSSRVANKHVKRRTIRSREVMPEATHSAFTGDVYEKRGNFENTNQGGAKDRKEAFKNEFQRHALRQVKQRGLVNASILSAETKRETQTAYGITQQKRTFLMQNHVRKHAVQKAYMKASVSSQKGSRAIIFAAKAVARAAASVASSLLSLSGGTVAFVVVLLIALIGAMAASPFGIFFSGEHPEERTVPLSAAIGTINAEFSNHIEAIQHSVYHDRVVLHGQTAAWADMIAVFATETTGNEASENAMDVVTIDQERIDLLTKVFWDMNEVSHYIETIQHGSGEDSWTEYVLHIVIDNKTCDEMVELYHFDKKQREALTELLAYRDMIGVLIARVGVSTADAYAVMQALPQNLSADRKAFVKAACSLVGKVNYFWGGKSSAIGWDSRWGTIKLVTAPGNSTSDTYQIFGLDCSGFATWAYINAASDPAAAGVIGNGTSNQRAKATDIPWSDAQPGDLAFYPDNSHVGIVAGWDEGGNLLVVHCASGQNNVVISNGEKAGFTIKARLGEAFE